jgi:glycosyltransferase involved in cell wall biosynthesis
MKGISVVVVTHNRPEDVKETVTSLLNQSFEPAEIILVDDTSDPPVNLNIDSEKLKIVRFDNEVGLSNARNCGISLARGEYVAFIDDDAIASKHWLEKIWEYTNKGFDILGGPIKPLYEAPPPDWWDDEILGSYAGIGNTYTKQIWGTNMVFRQEIFRKIGKFRPDLGRNKGKLLSHEERDLIEQATKRGHKISFVPGAQVFHKVKWRRMTLSYILQWAYYDGKSLRALYGYQPSKIFIPLLKAILSMIYPSTILQKKAIKIQKLSYIIRLFSQLI